MGLVCLEHLAHFAPDRELFVMQVGKSHEQADRFRRRLPDGVTELRYSPDAPAEHWRVLDALTRNALASHEGVWFVDHDVIFEGSWDRWLAAMDDQLLGDGVCCLAVPRRTASRRSLTSPFFWLSPSRLPADAPSFAPIPDRASASSRRPDLFWRSLAPSLAERDTLDAAFDALSRTTRATTFSLDRSSPAPRGIPAYDHVGGLHALTWSALSDGTDWRSLDAPFRAWMKDCHDRLRFFFASCDAALLDLEDPSLLRRLTLLSDRIS